MTRLEMITAIESNIGFLCDYNCSQEAKYFLPFGNNKKGAWCCSKSFNSCPEMKKKNSKSLKGRIFTKEHKRKISENHKGGIIRHSEKSKRKMSETKKQLWQNPTWDEEERRKKISEKKKGKNNPAKKPEIRKKISESMKGKYIGERNPNWRGGISKLPYSPDWGPKVKGKVFNRDGFQCRNPECWGTDESLVPHHIDYDKGNCDSTNLITLCGSCNGRANKNRKQWQKLYEI